MAPGSKRKALDFFSNEDSTITYSLRMPSITNRVTTLGVVSVLEGHVGNDATLESTCDHLSLASDK